MLTLAALAGAGALMAQNPYMPMWEYIPDGEPYVFEDPDQPGKYRVYVYGSHDDMVSQYCGRDQVVWSASVDDLSNWRYDGVIFASQYGADGRELDHRKPGEKGFELGDVLYAPDIAVKTLTYTDQNGKVKTKPQYYLYPNNQAWGRNGQVAVSDRPDGPFTVINWDPKNPTRNEGILAFDPAVFVDDDGRVYGYWGFEESNGAELDPETMATVKPGTSIVKDMVSNCNQPGDFRFFEASSMRKIDGKYVFIYSRKTADGEFGLPASNYTLAYAYSDSPLGPFTYGGTIIDGRARDKDLDGNTICTANPYGNTHGSIQQINGKWWVFYHRQTGTNEYSRQAMVAPITVKVTKDKVEISEGEYNSEGFMTTGLNPLDKTPAGLACYLINPKGVGQEFPNFFFTGSYLKPIRDYEADTYQGKYNQKIPYSPVVNNTPGSIVGYKYFNMTLLAKAAAKAGSYKKQGQGATLRMHVIPENGGTITVWLGAPSEAQGGRIIGTASVKMPAMDARNTLQQLDIDLGSTLKGVKGKQPLFFTFAGQSSGSVCQLYDFQFTAD